MSQKGKAHKHLAQIHGTNNRVSLRSTDINILTNLGVVGKLLKPPLAWIKDFFDKGAHIKRLQLELDDKDAEILKLKRKVIGRIEDMFEAQQQVLSIRTLIQSAFDDASNSGKIEQATYASLQDILGDFTAWAETSPSARDCNRAGIWVSEQAEGWIKRAIKKIACSRDYDFSPEDLDHIRQDLQCYFDWLHECLAVYAEPLYGRLREINKARCNQSLFMYREVFEYIQATGDFDSLNDAELYWVQRMLSDLKDNL